MMGMELWRPDWFKLMKDCAFDNVNANELVTITNETARLALSCIREQQALAAYHNYGAAAAELRNVLDAKVTSQSPKERT